VATFAKQVAALVADENPGIATVERTLKRRKKGQIYLDHLQNARGKSVVAPYSVRPRAGATVSAPLDWDEVESREVTPQDFTIKNMRERLARRGDLFAPVLGRKQNLSDAMEEANNLVKKRSTR
jgi:bifunctional non-homologous end joining protein LigD